MARNNKQNYITSMVNQWGDQWVVATTPEAIQKQTPRFVKEMVLDKVNYETVGKYILDPKVLENMIIACNNELEINTLYMNAVAFYREWYPYYPNIGAALTHVRAMTYIYSTVLDRLMQVKYTGNIGYLSDIPIVLNPYRNHFN